MVTDIVNAIINTITGLLAGIGAGIVDYFESVFINRAAGVDTILNTADDVITLSSVGTFVFVLLGIGAAFGLATLVFSMVRGRR